MLYRAPDEVGGNGPALPELGAAPLAGSADWQLVDTRALGKDTLHVYERT
jgi:riboflavin biosynthesis pyrimidine reductase